jgi:hypothetical protein
MSDGTHEVLTDGQWSQVARRARASVFFVGNGSTTEINSPDRCLPGEPNDDGRGNVEHIIDWYAQLHAMIAHQLRHLADSLGGTEAAQRLFEASYERYMCVAAVTPGWCSHWRELHGECLGPFEHNLTD